MRPLRGEVGFCDFEAVWKTKWKYHLWIFIRQKTQYLVPNLSYYRDIKGAARNRCAA